MTNKIAALLLSVALIGCVSSGTQVKDTALSQFRKGQTTEADVVKALGPPQSTMTSSGGGRVISYVGMHAQTKAATFVPIVGLFAGGASSHVSVVTFTFDRDGKLTDYMSQQSEAGARSGFGAGSQPAAPDPKVVN